MALYVPPGGLCSVETHVTNTTDETAVFSISVTAGGTAHVKNTTYTTLIATTTYESFGIAISLAGLQTTASTNQRCLVDIAVGAASSESVIIPNLTCGNVADMAAAAGNMTMYFFPLYIPAGVRISATSQASTISDIVNVSVRLFQNPIGVQGWYGHRVTAYGAATAASDGTSHTPGNNTWGTDTQLTASTTYPIRAMQLGVDMLTDTTAATSRYLTRIRVGATQYVATMLPHWESTTIEAVNCTWANMILSHMRFNIPSAQSLYVSSTRSAATPEARGYIIYGVD